ncbi:MAG: antirepressor [Bacteroidetes bacterium]|nr:MAG: antirepressor [Bacteroidota bacterium]
METKIINIARVNDVTIQVVENGQKLVPVRPICDALGIAFKPQFVRLKDDPILSSTVTTRVTVGADGKQREMTCIPLRYVFGWLFMIDSRNVKEEARESVIKYQKMCYDALYNYFAQMEEFLNWKQKVVEERLIVYDNARIEFREAKDKVQDARDLLNEARKVSFEQYYADKDQLKLDFDSTVPFATGEVCDE